MARKKKARFFVTDAPVCIEEFNPNEVVSETEPNRIWILARMNVETAGKVGSELLKLDQEGKTELHAGANQTALLIHNVVRWEGPDFEMLDEADQPMKDASGRPIYVPCTPENIRQLDHRDPFIERVLDEISERNQKRTSPKAGAPTTNGSTIDIVPDSDRSNEPSVSLQLATGISRSPLQSAITGRLNRSDG